MTDGGPTPTDAGVDAGICSEVTLTTEAITEPVDIIVVTDNSASMADELAAVEALLHQYLFVPLQAANGDVRIIVVGDHGGGSFELCIAPPLSGTSNCSGQPVDVPGQFYHYDISVQSVDGACLLLDTLYGSNAGGEADQWGAYPNGWIDALRPDAVKAILYVGDDRMACRWSSPGVTEGFSACDATVDGDCLNDGNDVLGSTNGAAAQASLNFANKLSALAPNYFRIGVPNPNTLWFSRMMLSNNSRASSNIASRNAEFIIGNTSGSNVWFSRPVTPSHWAPKLSNNARERGCSISRLT